MDDDRNLKTYFHTLPLELQNRIFFRSNPFLSSELGTFRQEDFRSLLIEEAAVKKISPKELKRSFESSLRRKCLVTRNINEVGNLNQTFIMIDTTLDFQTRDTEYFYTVTHDGYDGMMLDRFHETTGDYIYGMQIDGYEITIHPRAQPIDDSVVDVLTLYTILRNRAKALNLSNVWLLKTFLDRFERILQKEFFKNPYSLYIYLHVSCAIFEFDVRIDSKEMTSGHEFGEDFPGYDHLPEELTGWVLYRNLPYVNKRIPELIEMIRDHIKYDTR